MAARFEVAPVDDVGVVALGQGADGFEVVGEDDYSGGGGVDGRFGAGVGFFVVVATAAAEVLVNQ